MQSLPNCDHLKLSSNRVERVKRVGRVKVDKGKHGKGQGKGCRTEDKHTGDRKQARFSFYFFQEGK